jgi:type II secretory pathway pseudopilin PulG
VLSNVSGAAFTLIELMVVIGVIILLAAMTVGGVTRAVSKGKETRVRAELAQLVTAIEAYKVDLNSYPPDHPTDPARAPLFYELSGVMVDNQSGEFLTRGGGEVLPAARVKAWFGIDGFQNAVTNPDEIRSYLALRAEQHGEISNPPEDVEVLLVPVAWPRSAAQQPIPGKPGLNPWRYRHPENRMATNNSGSFELWAEYVDGNAVRVISNWRSEVFVDRDFAR